MTTIHKPKPYKKYSIAHKKELEYCFCIQSTKDNIIKYTKAQCKETVYNLLSTLNNGFPQYKHEIIRIDN